MKTSALKQGVDLFPGKDYTKLLERKYVALKPTFRVLMRYGAWIDENWKTMMKK